MVRQAYAIVRANGTKLKLEDLASSQHLHIRGANELTDGSIMLYSYITSSPEELEGFRRDVGELLIKYKGLEVVQRYVATKMFQPGL